MDRTGVDAAAQSIRRARVRLGQTVSEKDSVISSLDDMVLGNRDRVAERMGDRVGTVAFTKLQKARETGEQMQKELGALCSDLEDKLAEIGYQVSQAYSFRGKEKIYFFFGQCGFKSASNKAHQLRITRLENQDVKQSVELTKQMFLSTIEELGGSEDQFKSDITTYKAALDKILEKLKEANPKYKAAKEERTRLEAEVKNLKLELEAGTVTEDDRPAKEKELEDRQREYESILLEETDLLEIVNNAQRAIPEVQKNREAASKAVVAIHQMRRGLLEKMQNFETVLENVMTAIVARAKIERYNVMDPAMNKTVTAITNHNIAVAGAAMEVAVQRALKAAIDPKESARLTNELLRHINDFMKDYAKLEEEARAGNRGPTGEEPPETQDLTV